MSRSVASAAGEANWVKGIGDRGRFESVLGHVLGDGPDGPGELLVRPEHLVLTSDSGSEGASGVVHAIEFLGRETHALVDTGELFLSVRGRPESQWRRGDRVRVCWRQDVPHHRWFEGGS